MSDVPASDGSQAPPLHADHLTWAVLLGRWVEFARGAVALPREGPGALMRESIADVIMLQAVWFALQNLHDLAPAEQALGVDRATVLIEKHSAALESRWSGSMPESMRGLIADARGQLDRVRPGGTA